MVPADYATNTLTSTGTAVADGDTVTINTTVYTAKTSLSGGGTANQVLIDLGLAFYDRHYP
jgi:FKBP-type peptidyl-prolyl cis-trans isomerase (trigger factor)